MNMDYKISLGSSELRRMADILDQLTKISLDQITTIEVGGHILTLERFDDQRDGPWFRIINLRMKEQ